MTAAAGSMREAGLEGEYPSTVWRYWVTRNIEPNMAKYTMRDPGVGGR